MPGIPRRRLARCGDGTRRGPALRRQRTARATASKAAPWYVIPADKKWFARLLISEIVVRTLEGLDPQYPAVSEAQKQALQSCRKQLEEA